MRKVQLLWLCMSTSEIVISFIFSRTKCAHKCGRAQDNRNMKSVFFCWFRCCRPRRPRSSKLFGIGIHGLQRYLASVCCIDHCSEIVNVDQQIAFTYRLARSFFIVVVVKRTKTIRSAISYMWNVCQSYFLLLLLLPSFWFLISHKIPLCVHVNYEECFCFVLFLPYARFSLQTFVPSNRMYVHTKQFSH